MTKLKMLQPEEIYLMLLYRSIQQYNIVKKREHYVKRLLVIRCVVTQWSRNNGAGVSTSKIVLGEGHTSYQV